MSAPVPRDQAFFRFSQICRNCGVPTELVEDHAAGDLICKECGLVLESHAIEETSEWRSFSDSDKAQRSDPNRVGGPSNQLLAGGGLGTSVAKGSDKESHILGRLHARGPDPDRALLAAFSAIGQLCHLMGLPQIVKDAASETFKLIKDKKAVRGRSPGAVHAACVYIACRQEGIERGFREVCGAAAGTTVREIGRVYKAIIAALENGLDAEMAQKTFSDEKVVVRLAATLALPSEFTRAARELTRAFRGLMAEQLVGLDANTRKQPASIATAGLWLALQLHGGSRASLGDLSTASSMAAETIETASRWMFPHVRQLAAGVASEFRRPDAIRRIEAAYPIDASVNSLESKVAAICVDRSLCAGADVAAAAELLVTAVQKADSAAGVALAHAGAKPSGLAAAVVWLALRLRGGATPPTLVAMTAASGADADDCRVAARVLFPRARDLAALLPPAMRSEEALARLEAEHPRLLWMGTAAQLAPSVASAAAAAAAAAGVTRVNAASPEAAAAAAGALDALRGGGRVAGVAAGAESAATAAAAVHLLARLAGAPAPTLAHAAAAAYVDAGAMAAVERAAFPHARTLLHELPPGAPVADGALAALEQEFPPPAMPLAPPPAARAVRAAAAGGGAPMPWVSDLAGGDIF